MAKLNARKRFKKKPIKLLDNSLLKSLFVEVLIGKQFT